MSTDFHRTVKALLERFSKYIAGDTSAIPVDLFGVVFRTVGTPCFTLAIDANGLSALGGRTHRRLGVRRGAKAL